MQIGRLSGLFLLLWMGLRVNGEETMSLFIEDVLSTFKLKAPTIIYDGDEPPEICYTKWWVLCLPNEFGNDPGSDKEVFGNDSEKNKEEFGNNSEKDNGGKLSQNILVPLK